MFFAARFRQGMKAAIPIWIAFVPSSIAWGIAAQDHGLTLQEIVLMSAWVYSGPGAIRRARSAGGKQVGVASAGRGLADESALPADEHGLGAVLQRRATIAFAVLVPGRQRQQFYRALSAIPKRARSAIFRARGANGYGNLAFFLGVGTTAYSIWVIGTAVGFGVALGFPSRF